MSSKSVAVLVLGDLNRSPRMLNHCIALSEHFCDVSLIGFDGGDIREDIYNNKKVHIYYLFNGLKRVFEKMPRFLFILVALIKIFIQIINLFYVLLTIPSFSYIIIQNPPGIPAFFVAWITTKIRGGKMIIDWHNYGFTILAVNGRNKIVCYLAYLYEKFFSKKAYLNFCVSSAEVKDLKKKFDINCICLPDRPVKGLFKFLGEKEGEELFKKYGIIYKSRPFFLLTSTSWTEDENIPLLINSLEKIEKALKQKFDIEKIKPEKKVFLLMTGRGPLREAILEKIKEKKLEIFEVKPLWLSSDDYVKLPYICDLGISLHYSSSGIDLPMKVVDMFSGCLPVANIYYKSIGELVQEGKNGFIFKDENDLIDLLTKIIYEFSKNGKCEILNKYRNNLSEQLKENDWVSQWTERVKPALIEKNKHE